MFIPEKMEQINVLFFDKDVEKVAEAVVRQGALQIVDAAEVESWAKNLIRGGSGEETGELKTRREQVEGLINELSVPHDLEGIEPLEAPWAETDDKLEVLERSLRSDLSSHADIEDELVRLKELRGRIDTMVSAGFPLKNRDEYSYLAVEIGHVAGENMAILRRNLESFLHVLMVLGQAGEMTRIVVIALRRDRERLQTALKEAGFQPAPLEEEGEVPSPELSKKLDQEIDQLREKKAAIQERIEKLSHEHGSFLKSVLLKVRRDILTRQILMYFRKTERTYFLSGWIPIEHRDSFIQEIRKSTQNRCIIEEIPAEKIPSVREGKINVPVELKNPRLLRPFEILTKTYGIPSYTSIDPTPVLGISFLLMFGVMFGDVGHGLVLCLLGLLMFMKSKKASLRNAGLLLTYGGISSIVFGFLFGSLFGLEDLLPTLWLKPMESISQLFKTAIYFGVGMITLAMAINVINGIRRRDFLGLIFDKAGLLAAVLYWCGILVVTRLVTAEARGDVSILVPILMMSSVVLLFLREPIVHLIQGKRKLFPEGLTTGIMGGMVEILEILLGFLANTVSFIRVAAFGLAHAGLFMAIFALSDAVSGMAGGFISALVLVTGNIVIIALEGLVVSIQAVRLEFYEFFSRFFQQGSIGYRPLEAKLKA